MKTWKRALLCGILCIILAFCGLACTTPGETDPDGEEEPEVAGERELLYGIGEPLFTSKVKGFSSAVAIDLMEQLGVRSYRSWMEESLFENILLNCDPESEDLIRMNEAQVEFYHATFSDLLDAGIRQIVGHGIFFPRVESTVGLEIYNVPERDVTEGSEYMEWLRKTERMFEQLAKTFPEIEVWEVANESNAANFMHPASYESDPSAAFTQEESAAIITDFMYYASRGVHAGNPEAIAINPGWSPYLGPQEGLIDVKNYFEKIYANIESGNFPAGEVKSTDSSDYFQGLAWHPYYSHETAPDEMWKQLNDDIFSVAQAHGDGDLKVWFTEIGFSSGYASSASEEEQATWYQKIFDMVEEMPYVESVHIFRLFESTGDSYWGGPGETKFGLFREPVEGISGFAPNAKAYALQKIYGGTGDLEKYVNVI